MTTLETPVVERGQRLNAISAPDLGWVRYTLGPHADVELFHGVARIRHGAIFTECNGSMSKADEPDFEERPAIGDRCRLCQARRAQRRLIEQGLMELCEATEADRG